MTPRDRHEGRKHSAAEAQKKAAPPAVKQVSQGLKGDTRAAGWPGKQRQSTQVDRLSSQADRRQSMAFSILNTPKKLGNSLLRRGASKKALSKASPNTRSGTRRSPRIATTTASAATAAAIAAATPRAKGKVGALRGNGEGSTPRKPGGSLGTAPDHPWDSLQGRAELGCRRLGAKSRGFSSWLDAQY